MMRDYAVEGLRAVEAEVIEVMRSTSAPAEFMAGYLLGTRVGAAQERLHVATWAQVGVSPVWWENQRDRYPLGASVPDAA